MTRARIVIVTGGADGIGWATCRRFAAAGDLMVIADKNGPLAVSRAASLGHGHLGLCVDVSSEEDVKRLVATCVEHFGRLDVLVNNAGVIDTQATPVISQAAEDVRSLMGVNVTGVFLAAREAGRVMLEQGRGAIINLASGAGLAAVPFRNGYGASKAAVAALTRTLGCEWAARGVRVNAVAPGYTRTEMVERLIENGKVDPRLVERRVPLGRMARPDEIAEVIFFLASEAAAFLAGALVVADGGFLAYGGAGPASTGGGSAPADRVGPRVIAVTGAASGVGAAIARAFAAAGDHVLAIDRDVVALSAVSAGLGEGGLAVAADVRRENYVNQALAQAGSRWGRIDVLVNGAGATETARPTLEQTRVAFDDNFDANLMGAYLAARAAQPWLARRGGAIVNLASIAGLAGWPPRNAYCASQAALAMLTRSLACEWASDGIRVNAVAAGPVETPRPAAHPIDQRSRDAIIKRTPIGRLGRAEEIAGVVRFLASGAASYLTGTIVTVDGGWSAYSGPADA